MLRICLLAGITLFIIGCAPFVPATGIATTSTPLMKAPVAEAQTTLITPNNKDAMPTPSDPALQGLIEKAKEDLAQRLSIAVAKIRVIEFKEVTWPDSSLGCPQPGMAYLQIPEDGALIVLEVAGQQYKYHNGGSRGLFLCEKTMSDSSTPSKIDLFNLTPSKSDPPPTTPDNSIPPGEDT